MAAKRVTDLLLPFASDARLGAWERGHHRGGNPLLLVLVAFSSLSLAPCELKALTVRAPSLPKQKQTNRNTRRHISGRKPRLRIRGRTTRLGEMVSWSHDGQQPVAARSAGGPPIL